MVESFPMKLEMSDDWCWGSCALLCYRPPDQKEKRMDKSNWSLMPGTSLSFFLWDLNSPDIFWKRSNMQSIQETIALHIACFPVQILEGSDSIMGYMTCCSQMSEVRVWRKVGKMHSRVVTLVFMKLDFNLFWQFLCPRFKMLGRIPTGSGHEGKKVHKRNRCFSKKTY